MLTATRRLKRSSDYSPKTGQTLAAILGAGKYNGAASPLRRWSLARKAKG